MMLQTDARSQPARMFLFCSFRSNINHEHTSTFFCESSKRRAKGRAKEGAEDVIPTSAASDKKNGWNALQQSGDSQISGECSHRDWFRILREPEVARPGEAAEGS